MPGKQNPAFLDAMRFIKLDGLRRQAALARGLRDFEHQVYKRSTAKPVKSGTVRP